MSLLDTTPVAIAPPLHLSWNQTTTGKQSWTIHHTPACANSCADYIRNWRPIGTCKPILGPAIGEWDW